MFNENSKLSFLMCNESSSHVFNYKVFLKTKYLFCILFSENVCVLNYNIRAHCRFGCLVAFAESKRKHCETYYDVIIQHKHTGPINK